MKYRFIGERNSTVGKLPLVKVVVPYIDIDSGVLSRRLYWNDHQPEANRQSGRELACPVIANNPAACKETKALSIQLPSLTLPSVPSHSSTLILGAMDFPGPSDGHSQVSLSALLWLCCTE